MLPELLPLTTSGRYPLRATDQRQDSACQKSRYKDTRTSRQQVGGIRALGQSSPRIPTNERKRKREETTINPDQRLYVGRKGRGYQESSPTISTFITGVKVFGRESTLSPKPR